MNILLNYRIPEVGIVRLAKVRRHGLQSKFTLSRTRIVSDRCSSDRCRTGRDYEAPSAESKAHAVSLSRMRSMNLVCLELTLNVPEQLALVCGFAILN